jgi:hypothetical protein
MRWKSLLVYTIGFLLIILLTGGFHQHPQHNPWIVGWGIVGGGVVRAAWR